MWDRAFEFQLVTIDMYMYNTYCTVSYAQGQTLQAYQREGCHTCIFTYLPPLQPYSCMHAVSEQMSLVMWLLMQYYGSPSPFTVLPLNDFLFNVTTSTCNYSINRWAYIWVATSFEWAFYCMYWNTWKLEVPSRVLALCTFSWSCTLKRERASPHVVLFSSLMHAAFFLLQHCKQKVLRLTWKHS